jgi:hypothetical protein
MRGTVIAYSTAVLGGVIQGEGGQKFYFSDRDFESETLPRTGLKVSFEPTVRGARKIFARKVFAHADA